MNSQSLLQSISTLTPHSGVLLIRSFLLFQGPSCVSNVVVAVEKLSLYEPKEENMKDMRFGVYYCDFFTRGTSFHVPTLLYNQDGNWIFVWPNLENWKFILYSSLLIDFLLWRHATSVWRQNNEVHCTQGRICTRSWKTTSISPRCANQLTAFVGVSRNDARLPPLQGALFVLSRNMHKVYYENINKKKKKNSTEYETSVVCDVEMCMREENKQKLAKQLREEQDQLSTTC